MDQFAQIAANGIGGNAALLEPVTPIPHETVICRLEQADAQPIAVKLHLATTEELKTELAAMREAYRPFLENHAPAFESLRRRMDLTSFLRDGQPVTIPEYGGPIGACKKTYETTFELPALLRASSFELVARGTVGALPQTPQGADEKGRSPPLDPSARLSWHLYHSSSACLFSYSYPSEVNYALFWL